jgi:hypothetical protein
MIKNKRIIRIEFSRQKKPGGQVSAAPPCLALILGLTLILVLGISGFYKINIKFISLLVYYFILRKIL